MNLYKLINIINLKLKILIKMCLIYVLVHSTLLILIIIMMPPQYVPINFYP